MTRNDAIIDASLPQLAGYFISVLTDDGIVDKAAELTKMFESYGEYLKAVVGEPSQGEITSGKPRINDDQRQNVLPERLEQYIAAVMTANPSFTRQEAAHYLQHSPTGRRLAEHLASTTKVQKGNPMTQQINILKLHNIASVVEVAKAIIAKDGDGVTEHQFSEILMGHCRLNKRANESDAAAFSRIFQDPDNVDLRKAYAMTKGYCQP
jgi:hypothetical protein